jgi:alpha-tubulin suppressor-like RCC1 family protein
MFSKTFKASGVGAAGMVLTTALLVAPGMAALTTGRATAWGGNSYGQLGTNSTADSSVPVAVDTAGALVGKTLSGIAAGDTHTCATADGRAYCWGNNNFGRLGNNSTSTSWVPVAVDTYGVLAGKTVTSVTAGWYHSCAVADGQAFCWGFNGNGRLGNDSTTPSSVPVAVEADSGPLAGKMVTAISAGADHTCVVADGKAFCWGYNGNGQLGNDSTAASSVPVAVKADSGPLAGKTVTAIAAGYAHSCAVADGQAFCWGYNLSGQLGNDSTTASSVPTAVKADSGPLAGKAVTSVTAGYAHSCAVADGQAFCWGYNDFGQLGNDSTTASSVPTAVDTSGTLADRTVTTIAAGRLHTCAVADGKASCWGFNGNGRLGNNGTADAKVPVAVDTSGPLNTGKMIMIAAGGIHTAALFVAAPQPPTTVTATAGDGQVTVSWTAPADDGGSPVLDYTVTATPGGAGCVTSGTSCVVSGLANGTAYTFTVTARNAIGTSTPSAFSAPVIPTAPVTPQPAPRPLQKQTASVKVPKKIKYKGKTVLLKKTVRTNAAQKAKAKVTVKPKKKKYSRVTTTTSGKVTITTRGKKKLNVTLKLTAPATSQYTAYSYTKKWTVKKKRS